MAQIRVKDHDANQPAFGPKNKDKETRYRGF